MPHQLRKVCPMTQPSSPAFSRKANAKDHQSSQATPICALHRVEHAVTRDGDKYSEVVPLLGFDRNNMKVTALITMLQGAIISDIATLADEYANDGDYLHEHFNDRADLEGDTLSPFLDHNLEDVQVTYRLTMDTGVKYDLFRVNSMNKHYGTEQVEIQICKVLQLKPFQNREPQIPALFKPPQLPDAAP